MLFSVCLSVRLSVRPSVTPFFLLCPHHRIIMKFSGVITNDQSKVHAKGQVQRSNVKVTEVKTQLNCLRTVTPVWIHIWWWNDAHSLMLLRRGALLFLKVIRQVSKSHGSKQICPNCCVVLMMLRFVLSYTCMYTFSCYICVMWMYYEMHICLDPSGQ